MMQLKYHQGNYAVFGGLPARNVIYVFLLYDYVFSLYVYVSLP